MFLYAMIISYMSLIWIAIIKYQYTYVANSVKEFSNINMVLYINYILYIYLYIYITGTPYPNTSE